MSLIFKGINLFCVSLIYERAYWDFLGCWNKHFYKNKTIKNTVQATNYTINFGSVFINIYII